MARKHEIDPTIQASMLPPTPGGVATAAVVELEGGFYKEPPAETVPLTPEQLALKAESNALYLLGRACKTQRVIMSMSRGLQKLKAVDGEESDPAEADRLAAAKDKSDKTRRDFRRGAKVAFGKSIGIETMIETEERVTGEFFGEVQMVRAKDPNRRAEFVERFRAFDAQYGAPNQAKQRVARRTQIAKSLPAEAA